MSKSGTGTQAGDDMKSPVLSRHTSAALLRLKHTENALEFLDILKDIVDRNEGLDQLVEIVEQRMDSGGYVLTENLELIISKTKSATLYTKAKPQLFPTTSTKLVVSL